MDGWMSLLKESEYNMCINRLIEAMLREGKREE